MFLLLGLFLLSLHILIHNDPLVSQELSGVNHHLPIPCNTHEILFADTGQGREGCLNLAQNEIADTYNGICQDPELHIAGMKYYDLIQVGKPLFREVKEPFDINDCEYLCS